MTAEQLHTWKRFTLIWLAVCAVLIFVSREQIVSGVGWGPDDQLRMVQLRDWLGGQSWFDTTQYRIGKPDSQPMHWPRWIELPLALVFLLFKPMIGTVAAETAAMVVVPLFTLGVVMLLVAKISEQIFDRKVAILAAALTATAIPIVVQLRPMRVDHHGWQIVLALAALWTMFWPEKRKGGFVLGAVLALWLSVSLEGLPVSAAFVVLLVWRWVFQTDEGIRLFWTLLTFLVVSFLLYLGAHGGFDRAINYCDAISPAHLWASSAAAAVLLLAIRFVPARIGLRMGGAVVAAIAALAVLQFSAPQCLGGAFNTMKPLVREYWLINVLEGLPIWYQKWDTMVRLLGGSIAVGLISLFFILRSKSDQIDRGKLVILVYAFVWAFLLSLFVQRGTAVAAAFALPFMAWAVHHAFIKARTIQRPHWRILGTATIVFLIMPGPLAIALFNAIGENNAPKTEAESAKCDNNASLVRLNRLPSSRLIAPFDFGPRILLLTPHSVLATSHHRNDRAMADQIRIFTAAPDVARTILSARKIHYIVACADEAELDIYARKNPRGLWAMLAKGERPDWLQPVHIRDTALMVWRIEAK